MRYIGIITLLILSACAITASPPPPGTIFPQDVEQCKAQPEVTWCKVECAKNPQWEGCRAGQ